MSTSNTSHTERTTVSLGSGLVERIDAELARIETVTGIRVSRSSWVVQTLDRHLSGQSPTPSAAMPQGCAVPQEDRLYLIDYLMEQNISPNAISSLIAANTERLWIELDRDGEMCTRYLASGLDPSTDIMFFRKSEFDAVKF